MKRRITPANILAVVLAVALSAVALVGCTRPGAPGQAAAPHPPTASSGATSSGGSSAATGPAITPPAVAPSFVITAAPETTLEPPSYAGYEPLPIIAYHQVDPKAKADIAITPAEFEGQLQSIKALGYSTITARQLASYHESGTPLPPKPMMITFDDGWRDQYDFAAPLLEKYGMTATFFVYPKMIGGGSAFMTRAEVVSLDQRGFDIESHTWGHVPLVRKRDTTFKLFEHWTRMQYTQTEDWLDAAIGKKPVAIAYPYGYYDLEAMGVAKSHGMKLGFTVDEGVADARAWDAMALRRFVMYRGASLAQFTARLTSAPFPATGIQPAPGSRVVGHDATLTADISALPADVHKIAFASGSSMGHTTLVTRDGKRYAVATLKGAKAGFRNVTLRATGADGRRYLISWGLVMGD